MKLFIKTLVINAGVLLLLLLAFEIGGQLVYWIADGEPPIALLGSEDQGIFRAHPFLAAVPIPNSSISEGDKSIHIDSLGHRISSPAGYFDDQEPRTRILCLGGSSTFGTGVTDAESWPWLLQQKLGPEYRVYNLGVPGYSSLEAIVQLSTVVPKLAPDLVILYQGWNELHRYHLPGRSADGYAHGRMIQQALLHRPDKREASAIIKFAHGLAAEAPADTLPLREDPDPYIDSLFMQNLRTEQELLTGQDVAAIFVPQVINVENFCRTPGCRYWSYRIANQALPGLMQRMNELQEAEIGDGEQVQVIREIMSRVNWTEKHFMDEGHFNRPGGEAFVDLLLPYIRKHGTEGKF